MSKYKDWKEWEDAAQITAPPPKGNRFDIITPDEHRRLASQGGRARHQKGTGHEFRRQNPDAARAAQRASAAARVRNRHAARMQREALSAPGALAAGAEEK